MTLEVLPYSEREATRWDGFCAASLQATLLHTRRFLAYHGSRFVDRSVLLQQDGRLLAVFPAALDPDDASCIVSHPGITYGGLVHHGELGGEGTLVAMGALRAHYKGQGLRRMIYKAVPALYHRSPAQEDLYALFRLGATRTRCDLSSTVDLAFRRPRSEMRRRNLQKAGRAGVGVAGGHGYLPDLWPIIIDNLRRKHDARPVHTLAEIETLAERFPENIDLVVATIDGRVEAGTVLFRTHTCDHAQYIGSSERAYQACALDAVFEHCIAGATAAGKRWFDFGICTEQGGHVLNDGLYRFKSGFGGGATAYEFYELLLEER